MSRPPAVVKSLLSLITIILLAPCSLLAEENPGYQGAYKITADLFINGTKTESVTIPADTRAFGEISGSLYLKGGVGTFARRWRIEFDVNTSTKEGDTWVVTIKDLETNQSHLVDGTLRTEPIVLFSLVGQMSPTGNMEVYRTLKERLTLSIKPVTK